MYVKICGIRDAITAQHIIAGEANAIGIVMSPGSPRDASPDEARAVLEATRDSEIDTVLVVRRMPVDVAAQTAVELGFDVLQLHGDYNAAEFAEANANFPRVWRAASLAHTPRLRAGERGEERLLVDGATPGSGETWDLSAIGDAQLGAEWLLAGGLNPDNVAAAIAAARPAGVDVSSGVERRPGQKDPELITRFITNARRPVLLPNKPRV